MAKNPTGNIIQLTNVRLAFPSLDIARAHKGSENNANATKYYSASFLLDKQNPKHVAQIKQCNTEIQRLIKEKWVTPPPKMKEITCFGKGEKQVNDEGVIYNGYEGMYFVAALNQDRPRLVQATGERDANGKPVYRNLTAEEADQLFYGGCYVTATINFWTQDNSHGKAIRCSLRSVKFKSHGEAFGGANVTDDELVEEDDDLPAGELNMDDDDDIMDI